MSFEGEGLPPATLIVPTRNRPHMLEGALRAALDGDLVPDEVVIVDQSDAPDTALADRAASAEGSRLRYEWQGPRGVSRARNRGAELARHEVLLFVDDDIVVDPGWCRAIRQALEEFPGGVVTGSVRPESGGAAGSFAPSTREDPDRQVYRRPADVDPLCTCNAAIRKSILRAVGGFDARLGPGTRYPAAEDNDLAHRLLAGGWSIQYEPAAGVTHLAWRTSQERLPHRWAYGRGQGAFLAKHLRSAQAPTSRRVRSQLRRYLGRAARELIRDPRATAGDLTYLAGLASGALEWTIRERGQAPEVWPEPADRAEP